MTAQLHAISLIQTGYTTVKVCYDIGAPTPPAVPPTMLGVGALPAPELEESASPVAPPWNQPHQVNTTPIPPVPGSARNGREKISGPSLYTFKADKDLVQVGDLVVVNGTHGPAVARVHAVDERPRIDLNAPYEYKWIMARVDGAAYQKRLDEEEKIRTVLQEAETQRVRKQLMDDLLSMYPEGSDARKLLEKASIADKVLDIPHNPEIDAQWARSSTWNSSRPAPSALPSW